mmetsp:Transcript_28226/g.62012  ORF Transcript_28226/g.62012 Transcript_28226/m.62012 type:complete len:98 (-) Transcript_28226:88-381(-)
MIPTSPLNSVRLLSLPITTTTNLLVLSLRPLLRLASAYSYSDSSVLFDTSDASVSSYDSSSGDDLNVDDDTSTNAGCGKRHRRHSSISYDSLLSPIS